ncbi:hypothetical protein [Acidithiobacillus sp.]
MNKQIAVVIMAVLAGSASVASAATVTPPPAIAKAMASVTHRYCQMVATNKEGYQMQKRLSVIGIKTPIRTGIEWPLVLNLKETCAPTKADLHLYKEANRPFVLAVRNRYHVPVWNTREAFDFCAKREGVKGWSGVTSFGQYGRTIYGCFTHKK